jgi:hypothetical protein
VILPGKNKLSILVYTGNLDNILKQAAITANQAFRRNDMSSEEVLEHLKCDKLYLVKESNTIVGFASFTYINDLLYLEGIVLRPKYQSRGCFYRIMNEELNGFSYFGLRTQNPVMYNAAKRLMDKGLLKNIYPNGSEIESDIVEKLEIVKKHLKMENSGFFDNGTYGGKSLYGKEYTYKDNKMNDIFSGFNSEKGDSVLVIGKVKK